MPTVLQALGLLIGAVLSLCVWRSYFSPLSDLPGPFVASFTRFWHMRRILKGDQNLELIRLHDRHGHHVRVAPDEVSISHPDALRKVLLTPLRKGDWYKIVHFPDSRFRNPSEHFQSAGSPQKHLSLRVPARCNRLRRRKYREWHSDVSNRRNMQSITNSRNRQWVSPIRPPR